MASLIYAPLESWRNTITDEIMKTITFATKSNHTQDSDTTKLDFSAPLENFRHTTTDEASKALIHATKSNHTQDPDTTRSFLYPRKHGSKYDTWSTMVTIWEFMNLGHPFKKAVASGNFLNDLRKFKFNNDKLHISNTLSIHSNIFEKRQN